MIQTLTVRNPATGDVIDTIAITEEERVMEALKEGKDAFEKWSSINTHARADFLKNWAQLIQSEKESIANVMTAESGKPINESLGEVDYATSYIDWYAEEAKRLYGRTIPANTESKRIIVTQQPVGLVAAITPWNFPAAMMTRKAAPALAAGCTFIVKPAEDTPLTTMKLVELAHQAGIPEKAIQFVNGYGSEVGKLFTDSLHVKKITFTGSTPIGKILVKNSSNTLKRVSMELGGHAPLIIAKDADLDLAVSQTLASKFRNSGQTCICVNRVLVHESIAEEFSQKLASEVRKLRVGNGMDPSTQVGPVINEKAYIKIRAHIQNAIEHGADLLCGNTFDANPDRGYFYVYPTVLTNVTSEMIIMQEETFGPVVPISVFSTLEEAVAIANGTPYGLAAYFFTNDYRTGHYLHERLDFGIIGWNDGAPSAAYAPFGGMKESGLGREGGIEGIEPYLETKYLSIGGVL